MPAQECVGGEAPPSVIPVLKRDGNIRRPGLEMGRGRELEREENECKYLNILKIKLVQWIRLNFQRRLFYNVYMYI